MDVKAFRIPLVFILFGLFWAITSDPVISYLSESYFLTGHESIRALNDVVFVLMAAVLLYLQIKREQVKLRTSESQYRELFMSNPNPMWIYNVNDLRFVEVNDAAIEKYGYSRQEFLNMTIMDIRPAADHERLKKSIVIGETRMHDGELWTHITRHGKEITGSITSHRLVFGNLPCSMVMITDLTELLLNEQKLQEALKIEKLLNKKLEENITLIQKAHEESRRMSEVINKISNLVIIVNDVGYILWVNQAFTTFTGYQLEEAVGKRPGEILFGPNTSDKTVQELVETITQKRFFSGEIINYKKNKEEYWTQLSISPIYGHNGDFKFFISVENIITERKEKEELLNRQYQVFHDIAWTNSHEIRKPLASMIGLLDLYKKSENEQERNQYVQLIERCSLELDKLVKQSVCKINNLEQFANPVIKTSSNALK